VRGGLSLIVVRPPKDNVEMSAGLELVKEGFLREFGTAPEPEETPANFFVAADEELGKVLGTIGLQVVKNPSELELEWYFDCRLSDFYTGPAVKVGGIGRYTATRPGVSKFLLCYVIKFAELTGVEFLFSFNRRGIAHLAERGGFSFRTRYLAVRDNIPEKYWPYFLNQDDPVIVLTQDVAALLPVANRVIAEQVERFRLELPGYDKAAIVA